MVDHTPSQDCPQCGRFVQDRPNYGLRCECGWKHLRGEGARKNWVAEIRDRTAPLPDGLDPDDLHSRRRQQIKDAWEGHTARLYEGAYGVESGDRLWYERTLYRVTSSVRWDDGRGHTLHVAPLVEQSGMAAGELAVPWTSFGLEVQKGDHYAVCVDCGERWPCGEVRDSADARRGADAAVERFEFEAEHPWGCHWCERFAVRMHPARRFKTERGLKQHIRSCVCNPSNWNLDEWVPSFSDDLTISGGAAPCWATEEQREWAVLVKRAAVRGCLPATKSELQGLVDLLDGPGEAT